MDRLSRIVERARSVPAAAPPAPPAVVVDPAAIADVLLGRRRRAVAARARLERAALEGWDAEVREGESLADAMARVVAEGMPAPVTVLHAPNLVRLREEFAALSPQDRSDEVDRHLWAAGDPSRVRTHFGPLLDALGMGAR